MPLLPLLKTNPIKTKAGLLKAKACVVNKENKDNQKKQKTSQKKVNKIKKMNEVPKKKKKQKKGRKNKKTMMKKNDTQKVVAYARTSTKTNQAGSSAPRQLAACARVAKGLAMRKVSETISGMLPLQKRTKLRQLLSGEYDTIVVESARALSRSVQTSEQIFNAAKENGVKIITSDLPDLFNVDGNPATNFMRRVMAAVTEFDRDVLVLRLQAGLAEARKKTTRRTQDGKPKVQGRQSLLQGLHPTDKQMKQLRKCFHKHQNGDFGWRPLCCQVAQILNMDSIPAVETVRRMQDEVASRD